MLNKTIQKINLYKTDLSDRVVEKMVKYLEQLDIGLVDLDLSKNAITDIGLKNLANSLKINRSIKYLNLRANRFHEDGLHEFVDYLSNNRTLQELSLSENSITNEGIKILSKFLPLNNTLRHLELARCSL